MNYILDELKFMCSENLKKIVENYKSPCPYCGKKITTNATWMSTNSIKTIGVKLTCCGSKFLIPRYMPTRGRVI